LLSPVYVTLKLMLPAFRLFAGIVMVAVPLARTVTADVYPPPASVTEPVGVVFPLPPLAEIVTVNG
jgi:hypothetical protein